MSQTLTLIKDEKIEPYFIKLVNSTYEVHQEHTPKNGGAVYTKFVCSKDSIRKAVISIAKRKLALKRRTKKLIRLDEYLVEAKELAALVETLLDDDSPERQIKILKRKVEKLEKIVESLLPPKPEPFKLQITKPN